MLGRIRLGESAPCTYVVSLLALNSMAQVGFSVATLSSRSDPSVSWGSAVFMIGDWRLSNVFFFFFFVCQLIPCDPSHSVLLKTFSTFVLLFECVRTHVNVYKACIQRAAGSWEWNSVIRIGSKSFYLLSHISWVFRICFLLITVFGFHSSKHCIASVLLQRSSSCFI